MVSSIGPGLLALVGAVKGDGDAEAAYLAEKTAHLRIFSDDSGKMNLSLIDVKGEALVVSQFTLAASWRKGRRPGFDDAASPHVAERLVELFADKLRELGVTVGTGVFGAHMKVDLLNDGPVTIVMDTENPR
jgi:D-tyrosyl-tRNA(Tyr) deacylase